MDTFQIAWGTIRLDGLVAPNYFLSYPDSTAAVIKFDIYWVMSTSASDFNRIQKS
jgi:hypothetical protein